MADLADSCGRSGSKQGSLHQHKQGNQQASRRTIGKIFGAGATCTHFIMCRIKIECYVLWRDFKDRTLYLEAGSRPKVFELRAAYDTPCANAPRFFHTLNTHMEEKHEKNYYRRKLTRLLLLNADEKDNSYNVEYKERYQQLLTIETAATVQHGRCFCRVKGYVSCIEAHGGCFQGSGTLIQKPSSCSQQQKPLTLLL